MKNVVAFCKDKIELLEEGLVIDGGDNEEMVKTLKTVLFDCEKVIIAIKDSYLFLIEEIINNRLKE
ncbi:hypothetical protein [Jeotgalibacillus marinus]|uniref:Uncharacterized protein n=1 Tax=Jeotgalibacillus marinus TaxID=86667 RepID=A0ABV3Q4U5_9BACL